MIQLKFWKYFERREILLTEEEKVVQKQNIRIVAFSVLILKEKRLRKKFDLYLIHDLLHWIYFCIFSKVILRSFLVFVNNLSSFQIRYVSLDSWSLFLAFSQLLDKTILILLYKQSRLGIRRPLHLDFFLIQSVDGRISAEIQFSLAFHLRLLRKQFWV